MGCGVNIEEEIAEALADTGLLRYSGDRWVLTAALAPLLNRVRAEALREAARFLRDFHSEYESAETLEIYAREIEQNSEGNET